MKWNERMNSTQMNERMNFLYFIGYDAAPAVAVGRTVANSDGN